MPPALMLSVAILNLYVMCFDACPSRQYPNKLQMQTYDYYSPIDWGHHENIYDTAAALSGEADEVDSVLEFALVSYFSPELLAIRPVKAAEMLPANNRTSALILAYATLKELAEVKFLMPQDTTAIGRYEGMVKFIQDKHGLTRAEIEAYFRDGVRSFVAEIVNEEFNKINFMIDRNYNAELTRNPQNGHYKLSYEGVGGVTKELSATSLEALSSAMSRSRDFSTTAFDTVRERAALIPDVAYSASTKNETIDVIVNFYLNPSTNNFNALRSRYRTFLLTDGARGNEAAIALSSALFILNPTLRDRAVTL